MKTKTVKHTSGKWFGGPAFTANITGRGRCNLIGIGNGSVHIGYVSITSAVPESEALANVRLIVHAGDLLKACKQSLITLDSMDNDHAELYRLLADAIERAEGNTL